MSNKQLAHSSYIKILTGICVLLILTSAYFAFHYLKLKQANSQAAFLFIMKAGKGSLKQSADGIWKLTIINPNKKVIYFTDRPHTLTGETSSQQFIQNWSKLGFSPSNPPNAALSLDPTLNKGTTQDTIIVTLENPQYNQESNTVVFTVKQSANPTKALQSFKQKLDKSVPEEFTEPSLFIDISDLINTLPEVDSFDAATLQG